MAVALFCSHELLTVSQRSRMRFLSLTIRILPRHPRQQGSRSRGPLAASLLTANLKGVSSMKLHRDLGITQKAAWHLAQRIRKAWESDKGLLSGPVEVDETYMGGKERLHAGRGPVGKTTVVGAKDRYGNKVSAKFIPGTDGPTLRGFVSERADPDATVFTDNHPSYQGLPHKHEAVKHSVSEYVRDQAQTNGIESFWATLKRGYHGTYHHMSPMHLDRYVTEF